MRKDLIGFGSLVALGTLTVGVCIGLGIGHRSSATNPVAASPVVHDSPKATLLVPLSTDPRADLIFTAVRRPKPTTDSQTVFFRVTEKQWRVDWSNRGYPPIGKICVVDERGKIIREIRTDEDGAEMFDGPGTFSLVMRPVGGDGFLVARISSLTPIKVAP